MNSQFILAIDQGTSSTKTLVFDSNGQKVAKGVELLQTHYGDNGFVEQEPEVVYQNVLASVEKCLADFTGKGHSLVSIAALGISNQRETFVVWDKAGKPLYNAVVWQCKRSVQICERLKAEGLAEIIRNKTGLIIDPYFSGTKLIWLNENIPEIKEAIQNGNAFFGTIDTWLLYKLTDGKEYATDYTNASRTLFFNLHSLMWDQELIDLFGLKGINLPTIKPSSASFGATTVNGLFPNGIEITAMIGDSHAAAFGEGCFDAGTAKATLGTGCSILMNVGEKPVSSTNGMVTTICWSTEDTVQYALEGVIVSCGATIEWLKNELQLFSDSKETEDMANAVADNGGVYLIPAFSGLGSPHWQMDRRASLSGMSFGTTKNHIVRAALESIPYQIKDVITAMEKDAGISLKELMTNGGMTANRFVMQWLSDVLNKTVYSSSMPDVSALGAAYLAGLQVKVYNGIQHLRMLENNKVQFDPLADLSKQEQAYNCWSQAIGAK